MFGYVVDLYRIHKGTFVNPHSWWKSRQLIHIGRRIQANYLLETGTYLGNTTRRCAKHFKRIDTIEIDPEIHQQARNHLKPYAHINCVLGDCADKVPTCLEGLKPEDRALIFLDGHFSGKGTGRGPLDEPAVDVIHMLESYKTHIYGIVIDDFRMFRTDSSWPSKSELFASLERLFDEKDWKLSVQFDQVVIERKKP